MTEAVQPVIQNIPPANQVPGFVPPNIPTPAPVEPVVAAPAPVAQAPDMTAALAAITAALQGTQTPVAPTEEVPEGSLNNFDIGSIEDPIIKSMATVMQTVGKGIDFDRALGKAIEDGRVDLIDIAYIKEKGGENSNELITIAKGLVQAINAKSAAITGSVHALAGGEQNWTSGVAVFNEKAPHELRVVVSQMLDSKKESFITAGAKLVMEFSKGSGVLPNAMPLVDSGASALPSAQALDKVTFQAELNKLDPNARDFQTQREALFSRRALGRKLGK